MNFLFFFGRPSSFLIFVRRRGDPCKDGRCRRAGEEVPAPPIFGGALDMRRRRHGANNFEDRWGRSKMQGRFGKRWSVGGGG